MKNKLTTYYVACSKCFAQGFLLERIKEYKNSTIIEFQSIVCPDCNGRKIIKYKNESNTKHK